MEHTKQSSTNEPVHRQVAVAIPAKTGRKRSILWLATGIVVTVTLLIVTGLCRAESIDPYAVMEEHIEALGGLHAIMAEKTSHLTATITLPGLSGTIEQWTMRPGMERAEADLTVIKQIVGNNGDVMWALDTNGKLQITRDEAALTRHTVDTAFGEYEHLDRGSSLFSLSYDGADDVGGAECHVIRVANSLNSDVTLLYIDTSTHLMVKQSDINPDGVSHCVFSDYREVDGVLHAFRAETEILPIGQKHIVVTTKYEANPELDPSIFDPPSDEACDYVFTHGTSSENVPMRFIESHIYMDVIIGCRESTWILDTGASMTVIDETYARELGLEPEGSVKGGGAGNTVEVSFVDLPPFSIQGIEFGEQTAAAIDIAGLFEQTGDLEVAGILGYDFLSRFVTRVDYANELLSFYDPSSFAYDGPGVMIDAPLSGNTFTIPMSVDGIYTGKWSLDLGASGETFHYPYAQANGMLDRDGVDRIGFGAGGRFAVRGIKFETVEIGGYVLDEPVIGIPTSELKGAFSRSELIGNLGNRTLRNFVLYLDYERQQVVFEKGDDYARKFPPDRSGLQLWRPEGDDVSVLFVAPGTPAERVGLREGDIVVYINDIEVEHLDGLLALRELMRADPGTKYKIGILRDGRHKSVKLKLEDLF